LLCPIRRPLARVLLLDGKKKLVVLLDAASYGLLFDADLTNLVGELVHVMPQAMIFPREDEKENRAL
jgi:hypothetical protein